MFKVHHQSDAHTPFKHLQRIWRTAPEAHLIQLATFPWGVINKWDNHGPPLTSVAPLHSYSFIFFNATCLNGENTDILIGGLLFWCACPQESGRAVADGDRQGWTLAVLRQCVPGMYNYPCVPSVCLCGWAGVFQCVCMCGCGCVQATVSY